MIDLHCHLLPGIDDGSPDWETSLAMARMAAADGITHVACTPHIMPGVYGNSTANIRPILEELAGKLAASNIELTLWIGADAHVDPGLAAKLRDGSVPTLGNTGYFLLEPPHNVAPPRLVELVGEVVTSGFVPIITHPERLSWVETHYQLVGSMVQNGGLVQLTAGSITGGFGRRAKYWSERMLDEGIVDIIASDAHNTAGRPPLLSPARDAVAARLGGAEAQAMVYDRPAAILRNEALETRRKTASEPTGPSERRSRLPNWARRLLG